jgi:hypothetical protein
MPESLEVLDQQCWMCLHSGLEVGLHAEMDSHRLRLEPTPTTDLQMGWLDDSGNAQEPLIEGRCFGFLIGGHRELHMVYAEHRHLASIAPGRSTDPERFFAPLWWSPANAVPFAAMPSFTPMG